MAVGARLVAVPKRISPKSKDTGLQRGHGAVAPAYLCLGGLDLADGTPIMSRGSRRMCGSDLRGSPGMAQEASSMASSTELRQLAAWLPERPYFGSSVPDAAVLHAASASVDLCLERCCEGVKGLG